MIRAIRVLFFLVRRRALSSHKKMSHKKNIQIDTEKCDGWESAPFLREFEFKPYYYLSQVLSPLKISQSFFKNLSKFQENKDHYFLVARRGEQIVGECAFLVSDWDSRLFGFKYGTVKYLPAEGRHRESLAVKKKMVRFLLEWCRQKKIDFLHFRVDTADMSTIHSLEDNGFRFIASVVRYAVESSNLRRMQRSSPCVGLFQSRDLEQVKRLGSSVFSDNRFSLDPRFEKEMVQKLYEKWVENSCSGKVQDKVFVYRQGEEIAGFTTCGLRKEDSAVFGKRIGAIDLVGVDPRFQGRGIAVKMVNSAVEWLEKNSDVVEAIMAAQNKPMIRILERFGFSWRVSQTDWHRWIEKK